MWETRLKLSEDFKRRFMLDPNRVYPINTPPLTQNIPTQTTTNTVNDRIDEMSKDTDDIGEWLYNQFFKTIETQVINKTNDDKPMTRRNMNDIFSIDNEPKHNDGINTRSSRKNMEAGNNTKKGKKKSKSRKSSKSRGKKSKSKVHGLRRKLLRITEDDSLFDSESASESEEDASTSSSSSSESAGSEDKNEKDDRDHGHKKVIIFNRRPRPPLPSFIFLPNMDTPYYPPIGLPPPPILPMYPMVPVPPMAPFLPVIEKDNNCQNATSKPEGSTDATTATKESSSEPNTATEEQDQTTVPDSNTLRSGKRSKSKIRKQSKPAPTMNSEELFLMRSRDLEPSVHLTKQMERMQLINTLKERLKMKKNKQKHRDNDANASDENIDLFGDALDVPDHMPKHVNKKKIDRNLNDVNFKYLSQLIHRAKLNSTEIPPLFSNINEKKMENLQKTRRIYDKEIPIIHYDEENVTPRGSVIKDQSDEYFMKLGRQIASLIRNKDVKLLNKATDAPKANSLQESINSILNENRYAPRSYWERFVRSPLSRLKSYLSSLRFYKEDNLFSLEDEVNTFASTAKPLSLQDIENLLTSVQKDNPKLNNTYIYPKPSEVSFNVNLLPRRDIKLENHFRRMHEASDNYVARAIKSSNLTKEHQKTLNSNTANFLDETKNIWPMSKVSNVMPTRVFTAKLSDQPVMNIMTRNESLDSDNSNNSSIKYLPLNNKMNTKLKISQGEYLKFLKRNPVVINPNINKSGLNNYPELLAKFNVLPAKHRKLPDKSKSTLIHYNNLNYFSDQHKQHYLFEATYPLDMPSLKQSFSKRVETDKPSYFHHEFHHFDYFD
ncbi:unnamed protein product [Arctia plantaginis]|uniref:Uncharacterized protein n=1 Tax=Arctia plantaginis TaxID=874455 RepID=A0A8S1B5V3_ARCPL|nr:unnamed protein product [Arctia plantaginis]CAB3253380.1 unnamed protein product [Arctia plantaginis]